MLPIIPPRTITTRGDKALVAPVLKIVATLEKNGERMANKIP